MLTGRIKVELKQTIYFGAFASFHFLSGLSLHGETKVSGLCLPPLSINHWISSSKCALRNRIYVYVYRDECTWVSTYTMGRPSSLLGPLANIALVDTAGSYFKWRGPKQPSLQSLRDWNGSPASAFSLQRPARPASVPSMSNREDSYLSAVHPLHPPRWN